MFKLINNTYIYLCIIILSLTSFMLSCSDAAGVSLEEDPNLPLVLSNMKKLQSYYSTEGNPNTIENENLKNNDSNLFPDANREFNLLKNITQSSDTLITASDGAENEYFGIDLAAGPNVTVVGSMVSKDKPGKAYIYHDYNGVVKETILSPSSGHVGDQFGQSVDTDGIWVVVGAPDDNSTGVSAGAVYIFKWDGTNWIEKQKLVANDAKTNNSFGFSVAISNDKIVVGDHTSENKGSAYVFKNDGFNWKEDNSYSWIQNEKLTAPDGSSRDYFGSSVAIYEDTIVVGAYGNDDPEKDSGSVYVFEKDHENLPKVTRLTPKDGDKGDQFGRSVAIYKDTIIVGAYSDDDNGRNAGSVYKFINKRYSYNNYQWEQDQKILASDGGKREYFGCSVSIFGDNVVVGAHSKNETEIYAGAAYLFKPTSASDDTLIEMNKFIASTPQKLANLGGTVDIYDDKIIAGAVGVNNNGTNSGGTYVFNNPYSDMTTRYNYNANHENTELTKARKSARLTQQFVNNLDRIETIAIKIGGNVTLKYTDHLTLILRDGCGNEIIRKVTTIDPTGLTSDTSWKWFYIDLNVDVEYGKYYHFEVITMWAGHRDAAGIILNTNQYNWGKLIFTGRSNIFPEKKKDILFKITGKVEKSKKYYLFPQTNIACPGRCQSVYDERNSYNAQQHFNIVIREEKKYEDGSFWEDYISNRIADLKEDIVLLLESDEGTSRRKGIKHVVPYNEIFPNMNFYIAIVDPDDDDPMQYKMYCPNSDADIKIVDNYPYGGGSFQGGILRPSMTDENWILGTPNMKGANTVLVHELFGHGISRLDDEYVGSGEISQREQRYSFNSDEIGCPRWCDASKDVYQVEQELDSACWDHDKTTCMTDNNCWYIGNDELSYDISYYFNEKTCIPKSIRRHNIGIDCEGNAGCYIGAPDGTQGKVHLNVAQPSSSLMSSMHGNAAEGFSTPVENEIRTQIACMFPLTCHDYDFEKCNKFQEDWEYLLGDFLLGCEEGGNSEIYRRR